MRKWLYPGQLPQKFRNHFLDLRLATVRLASDSNPFPPRRRLARGKPLRMRFSIASGRDLILRIPHGSSFWFDRCEGNRCYMRYCVRKWDRGISKKFRAFLECLPCFYVLNGQRNFQEVPSQPVPCIA